jgi:hypothetical protein
MGRGDKRGGSRGRGADRGRGGDRAGRGGSRGGKSFDKGSRDFKKRPSVDDHVKDYAYGVKKRDDKFKDKD